ncbi:regulatory protein TetR [Syncephalis pseudoplumigaleata]|uniref:Regulatory protein TetR n=1 Tax=Syncephalis pseudoplumigaleata TaxID=1712513 RepID=A0A4P9Z6D6_9FUNG|nr:regulatory protein TetR [Syncephalis pseudoplumigaleata]|eukprot:RKP28214.1 regulatory protein TetR [Syncephalis pseudoplumigaleata]
MGRPREFDIEKALNTAAELFWRKGYEGTSLSDLTGAIGITPPSFYFAFNNKEALFKQVVDRYQCGHLGFLTEAFDQTTPLAVAERVLYGLAGAYTSKKHPPGCLVLNSSLPCSGNPEDTIRNDLAELRKAGRLELRKRFKRFKSTGALPADVDPDALAQFILTVAWGMAVAAQSGASRDDLHGTVKLALRAWPA